MYKTIIVHVEATATDRVTIAADLAGRHDAKLVGLAAGMWSANVALLEPDVGAMSSEIIEAGRDQIERDLNAAETLFRELTIGKGVKTDWHSVLDFPRLALVNAANTADLIVIGSRNPYRFDSEYHAVNPGDVLMSAGRPLLIIPDGIGELKARNIVVAWKNTREARRALADALPVMGLAESVVLLQVKDQDDETDSIFDAQEYLRRHGISVRSEIREFRMMAVEDELLECARGADADLIIAGGYGRSRFSEWIFGGVTRELLAQKSTACQLSH